MGNYSHAFKVLAELFGGEIITPPPITKKTIDLGAKNSPDSACVPFKYNLGNYIESLELGATVLVQAGGGCRFGYYGEVQEEILKKLGYKFDFIKFTNGINPIKVARIIKGYNPKISYFDIFKAMILAYIKILAIDAVEGFIRKNIGFEKDQGSFEKIMITSFR